MYSLASVSPIEFFHSRKFWKRQRVNIIMASVQLLHITTGKLNFITQQIKDASGVFSYEKMALLNYLAIAPAKRFQVEIWPAWLRQCGFLKQGGPHSERSCIQFISQIGTSKHKWRNNLQIVWLHQIRLVNEFILILISWRQWVNHIVKTENLPCLSLTILNNPWLVCIFGVIIDSVHIVLMSLNQKQEIPLLCLQIHDFHLQISPRQTKALHLLGAIN